VLESPEKNHNGSTLMMLVMPKQGIYIFVFYAIERKSDEHSKGQVNMVNSI